MTMTESLSGYKTCGRCGKSKPITQFYKNRARKDGLDSLCKACSSRRRKNALKDEKRALRERPKGESLVWLPSQVGDYVEGSIPRAPSLDDDEYGSFYYIELYNCAGLMDGEPFSARKVKLDSSGGHSETRGFTSDLRSLVFNEDGKWKWPMFGQTLRIEVAKTQPIELVGVGTRDMPIRWKVGVK